MKYVEARGKVLKVLENKSYELGFKCPDCESGWVTMTYGPVEGAFKEGDFVDVKIGKITRGVSLKIEPYVETPDADWMPAIMMLARDIGIVEEQPASQQVSVGKYTVLETFMPADLAVFEPPAAGDAPAEVKRILDEVYTSCRQRWVNSHPSNKESAINKTSCSRIAWSAVHKAGWNKNQEGKWTKMSEPIIDFIAYRLKDNETSKIYVGLSDKEFDIDTLIDGSDVQNVVEEHQMTDFTLVHHWWGNGEAYEHYDLFINTTPQTHIVFGKNPLKETEIKSVQRKPYTEDFWKRGTTLEQIAPGQPGNPSDTMPCSIEQIDTGKVAIYENDAQPTNEWLARMEFFGKKLEGRWSFISSVPNIWNALKETTKLTEQFPLQLQMEGGISAWKETPDGLVVEGKALSHGVWNGMYWSPEIIKNSPVSDFDDMIIDVEHRNNQKAGKVLEKKINNADIDVRFLINDYETAQKIKNGEYKGLSIDALVFGDPVRRVITGVKQYKRLTVCHNPACKVCYFGNCSI